MINVQIGLKSIHEGYFYDLQPSQTHINEHPNMVLISTIYKLEKVCATEILCVLINTSSKDMHLTKGETVGFSIETSIKLDEITTVTGYYAPRHTENNCAESLKRRMIYQRLKIS